MFAHQTAEVFGRRYSGLEVDSGERLADVERLTVPIEVAVVVLRELGVGGVPPAEEATGQWHPGDDADSGLLRGWQNVVQRLATEGIEDDLNRRGPPSRDRRQCFVTRLNAHPVVGDDTIVDQSIQCVIHLIAGVQRGRWAVQLHQVKLIDSEVSPRAVRPSLSPP